MKCCSLVCHKYVICNHLARTGQLYKCNFVMLSEEGRALHLTKIYLVFTSRDCVVWQNINGKKIFYFFSTMAENCGVIFFNVDYRLAPEAKCPENVKDFYSVLKYVVREEI